MVKLECHSRGGQRDPAVDSNKRTDVALRWNDIVENNARRRDSTGLTLVIRSDFWAVSTGNEAGPCLSVPVRGKEEEGFSLPLTFG